MNHVSVFVNTLVVILGSASLVNFAGIPVIDSPIGPIVPTIAFPIPDAAPVIIATRRRALIVVQKQIKQMPYVIHLAIICDTI